jgi:gamma-glutamyltranspeptidase/glutathione hydrolase
VASMSVCPAPPAAEIGGAILARGGNAADAAVAAAFAQGVTNPFLCGLSGTAILLHMDRTGRTTVLNGECAIGSGAVPPAWVETLAGRAETIGRFIIPSEDNQVGTSSVMVPGFVATCWELFHRLGSGKIGWAELIRPSIRLAADGFAVYPYIADAWSTLADGQAQARPGYPSLMDKLARDPIARAISLKGGSDPYAVGDVLRQPAYGATLERLASDGAQDFYQGRIGRIMAEDLQRRGSLVRAADLAGYRVVDQAALAGSHGGMEIHTTPPPSPGVQILEMLAILERLGFSNLAFDDPRTIDLLSQVMRAGFVDNRDIKAVLIEEAEAWAAQVMEPARLDAWAARIRRGERITGSPERLSTGTTHLVVVDDDGTAISFTHSVGSVAGSGSVTPELGFLHNNFLGHFDPRPGRQMSILAGRRIGSGAPTIVRKDGRTRLVLGAPGGSRIITSILQTLLHAIDHRLPVDVAVARKRVHSEEDFLVHLEPGWPETMRDRLAGLGNTVRWNGYQARVQAIAADAGGRLSPGADPRGGAVATGR